MPANRSQFTNHALNLRSTNGITVTHWAGKLHIDKATHLARFYLDGIIAVTSDLGVVGYVGICNEGSANYNHHAPARRGCLRSGAAYGIGVGYQDGGLNTLGDASISFKQYTNFSAGVVFNVTLKSAHYVDTSGYGFNYKIDAVDYGTYTYPQAHPQASTNNIDVAVHDAQPNQTIYIKGIIVNAEGQFITGEISKVVPYLPWSVKGETQYASTAPNSAIVNTLYPASYPVQVGTVIYPNATQGVPFVRIDAGYYADSANWYRLGDNAGQNSIIAEMGALGYWPTSDPAYIPPTNPWVTIPMIHRTLGADWTTGCAIMNGGNRNNATVYKHLPTGKYYSTQSTSGSYSANGVYYDGTQYNGVYNFVSIYNGVGTTGNCNDGPVGIE